MTNEDGDVLARWRSTDLRALYRDPSVVQDAPQTWDDTSEAGMAVVGSGREGLLFNGGRWEGTAFDWLAHSWAQEGRLVDDEGAPIFADAENREKKLRAIAVCENLRKSGASPE